MPLCFNPYATYPAADARLLALGASGPEPVCDMGGNRMVGTGRGPCGNLLGLAQPPHPISATAV